MSRLRRLCQSGDDLVPLLLLDNRVDSRISNYRGIALRERNKDQDTSAPLGGVHIMGEELLEGIVVCAPIGKATRHHANAQGRDEMSQQQRGSDCRDLDEDE